MWGYTYIEDLFSVEYIQQCNISPVELLLRQTFVKQQLYHRASIVKMYKYYIQYDTVDDTT